MKKILAVLFCSVLFFGFVGRASYEIYPIIKEYVYIFAKYGITIWSNEDMFIVSDKSINLHIMDGVHNRIIVSLPTSPNGEEKIKCSLWFNPITQTLKATPINKITCGGIE